MEALPGSDAFSGHMSTVTTVTFKKIKVKKGQQIAFLKLKQITSMEGTQTTWDDTFETKVEGEFSGKAQFNLTTGTMKQYKSSGAFKGIRTNLSDDSSYNYTQHFAMTMKIK